MHYSLEITASWFIKFGYGDILLGLYGHQQNIKVEVEIKDTCIGVLTFKSQSKIEG